MPETVYNVEIFTDEKWWYVSQFWKEAHAVSAASRLPLDSRVRKVVKTVVWTKRKGKSNDKDSKVKDSNQNT